MRTNNRKGFTLIELLIVVVIIGILAAIAIPKFANTKEKAYGSQMMSDLKNLASVQESFFADNSTYAATAAALSAAPYSWRPSAPTANITVTLTGDATGWSAVLRDSRVPSTGRDECGIYAGTATAPNAAVVQEGQVACW